MKRAFNFLANICFGLVLAIGLTSALVVEGYLSRLLWAGFFIVAAALAGFFYALSLDMISAESDRLLPRLVSMIHIWLLWKFTKLRTIDRTGFQEMFPDGSYNATPLDVTVGSNGMLFVTLAVQSEKAAGGVPWE